MSAPEKMVGGKWTPGEWVAFPNAGDGLNIGIIHEGRDIVFARSIAVRAKWALFGHAPIEEAEAVANGHLLSAAPDMYEALKDLLFNSVHGNGLEALYKTQDRARAALAKAGGAK